MIAPLQDMKTCGKCFRLLPAESFRFSNKPAGKRHTVCGDCRRKCDQTRRRVSRQKILSRELRSIRRTQSVENLWNLVINLCTQLGGLSNFLVMFRDRILDEQTTSACRCSATRALLHLVAVADSERSRLRELDFQQQLRGLQERLRSGQLLEKESPQDVVFRLHVEGKLLPALRRMLTDGTLTLGDIDPPPCEAWE